MTFSVNLGSEFCLRQAPVPWNPPLAGPQGPEGRSRELGSPPRSLGGRTEPQQPKGGDSGFWQAPSKVYRPWRFIRRVANIWQNNLLEASLKEPCRLSCRLPRFPHTGSRSGTGDASSLIPNAPCHELQQRGKRCSWDGRLRPTGLAPFTCLNLLGCQFLFF